ncbi:hypothetical protein [Desulforamulus aeronauticus]|uniref:Tellurite resistance protein TerB n=1 Tax=Desulforamulus aeronauticus DSM 10349 TaxID=1121421 RepID=A0A1M6T493_9FIRM|nr:hypothetical protein [Desulforamulus aeronauticus]SHK51709.1 hypothetical protein SAMN02745123_02162 [Desulforamulus aeronauticus DSM 10349]
MELFKSLEDKITYVETLTALATANEKITESQKLVVYNIARNYNIPEEYVDRIWEKVRRKYSLAEILAPMLTQDSNIKLLLIQELIMIFIVSNKYLEHKSMLRELCQTLNIDIKLEDIKNHVLQALKEREQSLKH